MEGVCKEYEAILETRFCWFQRNTAVQFELSTSIHSEKKRVSRQLSLPETSSNTQRIVSRN